MWSSKLSKAVIQKKSSNINAGQKYCSEHSAKLLTYAKLPLSLISLFCLFLSGRLKQVLKIIWIKARDFSAYRISEQRGSTENGVMYQNNSMKSHILVSHYFDPNIGINSIKTSIVFRKKNGCLPSMYLTDKLHLVYI